ncbi:MAG: hypothetical protein J5I81_04580, partial [Nitrococcus mobilis]|nr:hypothetical protein [Nitrococcus mobilis]
EGQTSQRTRWETGHLRVIAELLPRFFVEAMRRGNAQLFAVALEAAIPPLAFLVLLLAGTTLASGLIAFAGGPTFAMFTTLGADVAMVLAVTIAWLTAGRELLSPRELITLPGYVAAKLPLYARALTGSKIQWVRSKRD